MNKKALISCVILSILTIGGIVALLIFGTKKINTPNDPYVGVKVVDFSNQDEKAYSDIETITTGGVYRISGTYKKTIKISANKNDVKLILDNVNIKTTNGPAIYVESADTVYIELVGDNKIVAETNDDLNGAIYSKDDLLLTGDGILTIESNLDGIVGKDDLQINSGTYNITAQDDGIVGKDSLFIKDGIFNITSTGDGLKTSNENEQGILTIDNGIYKINSKGDGIASIASLIISNGTFDITSGDSTVNRNNNDKSMKGIKSKAELTIIDGKINITSIDDSVHANKDVFIKGGKITCSSSDDGIRSDNNVIIKDGTITINKSYEGIEGKNITIDGGNIKVVSSDDGFNASNGDGSSQGRPGTYTYKRNNSEDIPYITINGGNVYINSTGDGIDSNGNILITGGTTYVDGPTNNGNGPMDYGDFGNYKFEVTGGELIAVGAKGMAVAPTSTNVTTVFINLDNAYKNDITIGDITYKPTKAYNSILICSDKLKQNRTYELKIANETITSLTLNNVITTYGTTGNFGGPGGGDHGGGPGRGW